MQGYPATSASQARYSQPQQPQSAFRSPGPVSPGMYTRPPGSAFRLGGGAWPSRAQGTSSASSSSSSPGGGGRHYMGPVKLCAYGDSFVGTLTLLKKNVVRTVKFKGASAKGLNNPNSSLKTQSQLLNKLDRFLDENVLLVFGTVDLQLNYYWRVAHGSDQTPEDFAKEVVTNYLSFIAEHMLPRCVSKDDDSQRTFKNSFGTMTRPFIKRLFISCAFYPTIEDEFYLDGFWKYSCKNDPNVSQEIRLHIPLETFDPRWIMTEIFNKAVIEFCEKNGCSFLDVNSHLLDKTGKRIDTAYKDSSDPTNIHVLWERTLPYWIKELSSVGITLDDVEGNLEDLEKEQQAYLESKAERVSRRDFELGSTSAERNSRQIIPGFKVGGHDASASPTRSVPTRSGSADQSSEKGSINDSTVPVANEIVTTKVETISGETSTFPRSNIVTTLSTASAKSPVSGLDSSPLSIKIPVRSPDSEQPLSAVDRSWKVPGSPGRKPPSFGSAVASPTKTLSPTRLQLNAAALETAIREAQYEKPIRPMSPIDAQWRVASPTVDKAPTMFGRSPSANRNVSRSRSGADDDEWPTEVIKESVALDNDSKASSNPPQKGKPVSRKGSEEEVDADISELILKAIPNLSLNEVLNDPWLQED